MLLYNLTPHKFDKSGKDILLNYSDENFCLPKIERSCLRQNKATFEILMLYYTIEYIYHARKYE